MPTPADASPSPTLTDISRHCTESDRRSRARRFARAQRARARRRAAVLTTVTLSATGALAVGVAVAEPFSAGSRAKPAVSERASADRSSPAAATAPTSGPMYMRDPQPADLPGAYGQMIADAADRHEVPRALLWALVAQESGFNPRAVSAAGAAGLTQLMPATAAAMGVNDRTDPAQSLDGGARYLSIQLRRFGDRRLALAAYNAGPGAVIRHRGVPPYSETRSYVSSVTALSERVAGSDKRS